MWVGTNKGLYKIDNIKRPNPICIIPNVNILSLYKDRKRRLWVATLRQGMYKIETDINGKFAIKKDFALSNNDVRCFVEDNEGNVWVGTFNGLNKIDVSGKVSYYTRDTQPGGLKHASIFSLYKDRQGTIWVGSYYGGVHYFNPKMDFFRHYSERPDKADGLSFFFVGNMVEDKRGDVWICTEGGGLNYFNRKTRQFTHYLTDKKLNNIPFYNLKCIEYDKKRDCLYVGTHKQGSFSLNIATNKIKHYTNLDKTGISFSQITLCGDSLYFLSNKGMFIKDLISGRAGYLYPTIKETQESGFSFLIDSKSYLWISQSNRVLRINMKNPQERYIYQLGKKGLGRFQVLKMVENKDGTLFFGTYGDGLYKFDAKNNSFLSCNLSNIRYCYNISVMPHGYLAISNELGLLIYHPGTKETRLINAENQLHLSAINDGCGLMMCRNGEIFVGGTSGMTSFMSTSLLIPTPSYHLYFSSLTVNDQVISCSSTNHILNTALPFAKRINLDYDENNIAISFASDNYINSNQHIYEYQLEGYSKEWRTIYGNTIVYTNIDPGRYKLIVREKQQSAHDKVHSIELLIIVHSPWWATWYAYLIYIIITSVIVYLLLKNWKTKLLLRASLAQEKMEKEKNEEITQAKLQFFANISHEFRTPLTLIISQIESLLQSGSLSPFLRTRLQKIYRNTFQLKELISELLDFRKMERGKLDLQIGQVNIIPYLQQICQNFKDQARIQNISLEFHADNTKELFCWIDSKQLRKVFSNLLSNALKHTPENGKVELQVEEKATTVEIKVIDSGEGIPSKSIPYIFDLFYQAHPQSSSGSGIGLALSKGLVELHHGELKVQSAVQYGTIFTVVLPKENQFQKDLNVTFVEADATTSIDGALDFQPTDTSKEEESVDFEIQEPNTDRDCILIVEDNEELLQILTSLFSSLYRVIIAMDGKEGLSKAMEDQPDLILSDIMMPEMDGIEMCTKIKNNFNLCHIPVVLLTALTSDNNKMEGLQCGADDYIEKPFSNKMLQGHVANILRNRKLLKRKFGEGISTDQSTETDVQALALNPIDAKFLSKLETIIKENISNSEFDVNVLAQELAVSRSSLYNKLKALSSITPNEFILNTRLKYASRLLKNNPELQITEIAYEAGFSSLRYFRYCFKASYNQTPQEYRNGKGANSVDSDQ